MFRKLIFRIGKSHKQMSSLRCTGHFNEPLNAKIVFSKGFHDFLSLIFIVQKSRRHSVCLIFNYI